MRIERLLITGAAGALGDVLRRGLAGRYPVIRLSDRAELRPAGAGEEVVRCELGDAPAVEAMLAGVDAVVHLGGQPVEAPWPVVLDSNLVGCINLWEAARKAGTRRVLFASSNHAIGFHRRTERLDHTSPARPDTRYGLSKAFGEDIGRYYADKHGISCMAMRIGSCFPEPVDERMLATWMSHADFVRLVTAGLEADYHYEIVYGVSANSRSWWDNGNAHRLGYAPQDNSDVFAAKVKGKVTDNPLTEAFQGGAYIPPDFTGDIDRLA